MTAKIQVKLGAMRCSDRPGAFFFPDGRMHMVSGVISALSEVGKALGRGGNRQPKLAIRRKETGLTLCHKTALWPHFMVIDTGCDCQIFQDLQLHVHGEDCTFAFVLDSQGGALQPQTGGGSRKVYLALTHSILRAHTCAVWCP